MIKIFIQEYCADSHENVAAAPKLPWCNPGLWGLQLDFSSQATKHAKSSVTSVFTLTPLKKGYGSMLGWNKEFFLNGLSNLDIAVSEKCHPYLKCDKCVYTNVTEKRILQHIRMTHWFGRRFPETISSVTSVILSLKMIRNVNGTKGIYIKQHLLQFIRLMAKRMS